MFIFSRNDLDRCFPIFLFAREKLVHRDFFFQSNKTIILEYFLKNFTSLKEEIDWGEYFVFAFVSFFFFFINNKLFSTIESLYCLLRYVRKCISLSEKEKRRSLTRSIYHFTTSTTKRNSFFLFLTLVLPFGSFLFFISSFRL